MLNSRLHLRPCAAALPDLPGSAGSGSAASTSSSPSSDSAVLALDATAIARLTTLDPRNESQLIERVMLAFQNSAARLTAQLAQAQLDNDRAAVRLVAHTLKSSSASIGALDLSRRCALLETGVASETAAELDVDIAALREALIGALQAIDRLLAQRAGG